jgi:hypothetical protein
MTMNQDDRDRLARMEQKLDDFILQMTPCLGHFASFEKHTDMLERHEAQLPPIMKSVAVNTKRIDGLEGFRNIIVAGIAVPLLLGIIMWLVPVILQHIL